MSQKRKDEFDLETDEYIPNKRPKLTGESNTKARQKKKDPTPQVNATYGQRSFFPEPSADDYDVDEDSAAVHDYLNGVRREASGIPHLLIASSDPTSAPTDESLAMYCASYAQRASREGGYYEDGAYVAAPAPEASSTSSAQHGDGSVELSAKDAYHERLLRRYGDLRELLSGQPEAPPGDISSSGLRSGRPPDRAMLAALPLDEMAHMIDTACEILSKAVLMGDDKEAQWLGAWCWTLLAKMPEVGVLENENVGHLRELGKKAAGIAKQLAMDILDDAEVSLDNGNTHVDGNHHNNGPASNNDKTEPLATDEVETLGYGLQEATPPHDDDDDSSNPTADDTIYGHEPIFQARRRNSSSSIEDFDMSEAPPHDDPTTLNVNAPLLSKAEAYAKRTSDLTAQDTMDDGGSEEGELDEEESEEDPEEEEGGQGEVHNPLTTASGTLDMILTIVGDCYGQRDLLPARDMLWDAFEIVGPLQVGDSKAT
ncbi:hypothetical protein FH972_023914 [Carpinus fangiana]|uniref:Uncharacterized protein n=1 Tax=Carpinus fangiana TaxID=176857 RepID=A0A5N6KWK1_9ROSI|nr:hypothetical protein FH972_023914 [Carpinus fangiana]